MSTADRRHPDRTATGLDVSCLGGDVDWAGHWQHGKRFAYVKATDGTGYVEPGFRRQYAESFDVGMIRGAYHVALPDRSSGADQAEFFVDNGGAWSGDGMTLPGALDLGYNPYGKACFGMSKAALSDWVAEFGDTYREWTGRYPVVYTSPNWWRQCAGADAGEVNPLWVARYSATPDVLPTTRGVYPVWDRAAGHEERIRVMTVSAFA
ncbi:GH25 family lysozyme [Umezawaea sp. Da 62-37]|uniref:GH25 family lysozyme n=1 Tax=Umezawaea sp. Da 62-37 TaxID=3075927 RepID=UPI0028F710FD|nr:GH25 family lysozyme [Umezawaea sp. Da 62-37]WNV91924.1 GH25 family lysozyme [Umezawaea sp. Da 62-37]